MCQLLPTYYLTTQCVRTDAQSSRSQPVIPREDLENLRDTRPEPWTTEPLPTSSLPTARKSKPLIITTYFHLRYLNQ